jgi:hypothetical protein
MIFWACSNCQVTVILLFDLLINTVTFIITCICITFMQIKTINVLWPLGCFRCFVLVIVSVTHFPFPFSILFVCRAHICYPRTTPARFGLIWFRGFRQTDGRTDDGRQVMEKLTCDLSMIWTDGHFRYYITFQVRGRGNKLSYRTVIINKGLRFVFIFHVLV